MKPTYVTDYQAIEQVLKQYIEGGKQAQSAIMQPAFSEQATMFSANEQGELTGGQIQGLFDVIDSDVFYPSEQAQAVIAYIDINGTAAAARVDTNDLSGFGFTDYFNLLKINGKWQIISKIFHTHYAPNA